MIATTIANQVIEDRKNGGKADIQTKVNFWNDSISHPGLVLTKDVITGHINNVKRRQKKKDAVAAAEDPTSTTVTMPRATIGTTHAPQMRSSQDADAMPLPMTQKTRPRLWRKRVFDNDCVLYLSVHDE